ncbi:unnamed protein product [Soboliphyme baturini]|uniref:N_BRCA1_IG domain-containing protein n=1 Tax=Soboliphyme baturini TaxID=241478 RepID=A0A183IFF8_9BILA|nr:unnamed protein product [Soboliphyme baturini]
MLHSSVRRCNPPMTIAGGGRYGASNWCFGCLAAEVVRFDDHPAKTNLSVTVTKQAPEVRWRVGWCVNRESTNEQVSDGSGSEPEKKSALRQVGSQWRTSRR